MSKQVKCDNCGNWSKAEGNHAEDRCEHCGAYLYPGERAATQQREDREQEQAEKFKIRLIKVKPEDPWYLAAIKYLGRWMQIGVIGVLTFIFWIISIISG